MDNGDPQTQESQALMAGETGFVCILRDVATISVRENPTLIFLVPHISQVYQMPRWMCRLNQDPLLES